MGKTCDICGNQTGFRSFRCTDGVICKHCYKVVSGNFTVTIVRQTLSELRRRYAENAAPLDLGADGFLTTKKIGTFLLLDEQRRKLCLPGSRGADGQRTRPSVYSYGQLQGYMLVCEPGLPLEQLATLSEQKKESTTIHYLAVRLRIAQVGTRDLVIIPSPVRSTSFAFRRGYRAANDMMRALEEVFVC